MLCVPAGALASACGTNPVCPYTASETLGASDPASLDGPLAIALTRSGDVVVVDAAKDNVREFDRSGRLVRQIGTADEFLYAHAVAVDPASGEIYIAEANCIRWFKPDGSQDTPAHCEPATRPNTFAPESIAAGPNGTVYAASNRYGTPTLYEFAADGSVLRSWPSPPTAFPPIAVDARGNVYFSGVSGDHAVREFDPTGKPLRIVNTPATAVGMAVFGSVLYVASGSGSTAELTTYDASGNAIGSPIPAPNLGSSLPVPFSAGPVFAVDSTGIVVVTSTRQVERLRTDGTIVASWGGLAVDDFSPAAAFGDQAGNVYVLDAGAGHPRVVRYDAQRDPPTVLLDLTPYLVHSDLPLLSATVDSHGDLLIHSWGQLLTVDQTGRVLRTVNLSCQNLCGSIAVDPAGDVYAADFRQIDKFGPTGALLATWPISARSIATDPAGNLYTNAGPPNGLIGKWSPTGTLIGTVDPGGGYEPSTANALAEDAHGNLYDLAPDGLHMFDPSGKLIAIWPTTANTSISVAPGGDVYVASNTTAWSSGSAGQVTRFYDFLNPLPPAPSYTSSPFYSAMQVLAALAEATQSGTNSLTTSVSCTGSANASCSGQLSLTTTIRHNAARAASARPVAVLLGRTSFSLSTGTNRSMRVPLNATARRLLRTHPVLRAKLSATYHSGTARKTVTRSVILHGHRLPAHHHHKRPAHKR
jgi:sugar lactone lactonase YvrE